MKTNESKRTFTRNACITASCLLAVIITVFSLFICGCRSRDYRVFRGQRVGQKGQISLEELREELNNFEDFWTNTYSFAINDIEKFMPDVRTRNTTLRLRVRIPEALHTMLEHQDPIIAFLETWGLCVRTTQYFESGAGRDLFGEHQKIIIRAAKDNEAEIERIGELFLDNQLFNETKTNLKTFAATNPIQETYSKAIVYATAVKQGEPNPFVETISLPLAPFRAMEGVDRGAIAIDRFTDTAQNFTNVVEKLPETSRWQMQLLFYDLEDTDTIKSIVESTNKISDSSAKLAQTADILPQRIRDEAVILIEEVDKKQKNIQTTLQQAENTAVAVDSALQNAVNAANAFDDTADTVTSTTNSWQQAAKATTEAIHEIQNLIPKREPGTESSFKITDVRDAAEEFGQTVTHVRDLTADLNTLIASEDFQSLYSLAMKLPNKITWRLALLILLTFLLTLGYRFISVRIIAKKQ
ncbi:MAG: hypothetical protein ACYTE8_01675 [Planctomycetota bacterium]|jgi:hypothetical protein